MEPKNQDKIHKDIISMLNMIFSSKDMQNLSLQKAHPEILQWDINPEGDIDSGFVLREKDRDILYFFPARGSYYLQYLPDSGHFFEGHKDQKELRDRIKHLKKELEKNNFPSPKHRYGAEIELQRLKNQIKEKRIYARFLAVKDDLLIFYLPGYSYDSLISDFFSKTTSKRIPIHGQSVEGMGRVYQIDENILEIMSLPGVSKREYPEELFNQYPKIKTIIMRSIDEHSLGPSGVQIENRREEINAP